ncbi:MAG: serine/threonine-protein kinase [Polyangiales bacterium]
MDDGFDSTDELETRVAGKRPAASERPGPSPEGTPEPVVDVTTRPRVSTHPSNANLVLERFGGGSRRVASARDAQARASHNAIRILTGTMAACSFFGMPLLLLVSGARGDKLLVALGLATIVLTYGSIFFRASRNEDFRLDDVGFEVIVTAFAVPVITLGFGLSSPFTGVVTLGFLLFSTSASTRQVTIVYVLLATGHAIAFALVRLGFATATGLGEDVAPSPSLQWVILAWVESEYLATFLVGLLVNRQSLKLFVEMEQAVRLASEREALLREIRAELEDANRVGGEGRFTGKVLGSYRLDDVIGRGGMGEVYAALHVGTGAEAAVKLLRRDALVDHDLVLRFEREAETIQKLHSPHVVTVLEVGGANALVPYIAMERLRGVDLAAVLRAKSPLGPAEALELARQVAAGLDAAHDAGVVHRDLKPQNLFHALLPSGRKVWKILDFGVAKRTGREETALTQAHIVGTPHYMAPEQITEGDVLDRRADVHALAAILYRVITGRLPFLRDDVSQLLHAVVHELPIDPRDLVDVGDDVAFVLRIGLAKKPADRFATAGELARAFELALGGRLGQAERDRARKLLALAPFAKKD